MGAFNTVRILGTCPSCKNEVNLEVQFKYGDVWQHHYQVGDVINWGGNDIGKSDRRKVIVEGFAICPICDSELDYELWLEKDRIIAVKPASGTYDLASTPEGYIVIEE
jgi:hypothetical protein